MNPDLFCHIGALPAASCRRKPPHLEDLMKTLALSVRRFLVSEDGPTAVEYAVMLALIVIVCLTAITSIGTKASTTFSNVAASIGGAS
jgi:pilus assembly protein Flp/PilA